MKANSHTHTSPQLSAALSPRLLPKGTFKSPIKGLQLPPSSPRLDMISSVTMRVSKLGGSALLTRLMAVSRQRNTGTTDTYAKPTPNKRSGHYSKASAKLDNYSARRKAFEKMDADMVVTGKVYNKTEDGITIRVSEVYDLSQLLGAHSWNRRGATHSPNDPFLRDLYSLNIQGTCHASEMADSLLPVHPSTSTNETSSHSTERKVGENPLLRTMSADSEGGPRILDKFSLGDRVKALVIAVDVHSERLHLSLSNDRLGSIRSRHRLGLQDDPLYSNTKTPIKPTTPVPASPYQSPSHIPSPSPQSPYVSHWAAPSYGYGQGSMASGNDGNPFTGFGSGSMGLFDSAKKPGVPHSHPPAQPGSASPKFKKKQVALWKAVQGDLLFRNPEGIHIMAKAYDINLHGSLVDNFDLDEGSKYKELRKRQNATWASENVRKGVSYAKQEQFENALKCYNHALEVDATHADAYVGKGAALVRMGQLENGVEEFRTALKHNPNHANAQKYLEKTQGLITKRECQARKEQARLQAHRDALARLTEEKTREAMSLHTLVDAHQAPPAASLKRKRKAKKKSKKSKKAKTKKKRKSKKRSRPCDESDGSSSSSRDS